jgi:hypothetical protein
LVFKQHRKQNFSHAANIGNKKKINRKPEIVDFLVFLWVNKFVGCLAQVKAASKSGYCKEDYITDALLTYRADYGKPFCFLRAWERVKGDPKWKADGGLLRDKKW